MAIHKLLIRRLFAQMDSRSQVATRGASRLGSCARPKRPACDWLPASGLKFKFKFPYDTHTHIHPSSSQRRRQETICGCEFVGRLGAASSDQFALAGRPLFNTSRRRSSAHGETRPASIQRASGSRRPLAPLAFWVPRRRSGAIGASGENYSSHAPEM